MLNGDRRRKEGEDDDAVPITVRVEVDAEHDDIALWEKARIVSPGAFAWVRVVEVTPLDEERALVRLIVSQMEYDSMLVAMDGEHDYVGAAFERELTITTHDILVRAGLIDKEKYGFLPEHRE